MDDYGPVLRIRDCASTVLFDGPAVKWPGFQLADGSGILVDVPAGSERALGVHGLPEARPSTSGRRPARRT